MNDTLRSDRSRARLYAILAGLLLVGIFLRFHELTGQSLWYDEGVSLEFSEGASVIDVVDRLGTTRTSERYQPLYFILLYLWRQLFGSSEWALRSLSALLGVLSLTLFVPVARRFLDGWQTLAAIAFMALSSFAVYYSQEARPYSLLLLVCVLHWSLIGRLGDSGSTRRSMNLLVPATAVSLLGGLTSLFFTFHVAAAGGSWLLNRDERTVGWSFWIVSALALVPSLGFFVVAGSDFGGDSAVVSRTDRSILANGAFSLYGLLVGTTYGPPVAELRLGAWGAAVRHSWFSLTLFAVVCAGLALAAVLALRRNGPDAAVAQRRSFALVLTVLGLAVLLLLVFTWVTKLNWLPRHSTFLLPSLALALGYLVLPLGRGHRVTTRIGTWSVCALLLLNVFSLGNYFYDMDHRRGDYRSVAEFLRDQQPVPVVLLLGSPSLLRYYDAPSLLDIRWKPDSKKVELVSEYTESSDRFLVVINRDDLLPGGLNSATDLSESFSPSERSWDFPAFRILEFQALSSADG